MHKMFWENPYQRCLETIISKINGNSVLFESTIIYSFSGGQESDKATVNGIPILDSKMEGNLIYYNLPEGHGLITGQQVKIEIDWQRRYRLMRLHFAAELILELITKNLKLEKIGAHIAENKARIDFNFDNNISLYFKDILDEYNIIISQNKQIVTGYSDISNQKRYWEIDGFAKVPCGGTHVKSTGEVGYVNLRRKNIGLAKERIEITLENP